MAQIPLDRLSADDLNQAREHVQHAGLVLLPQTAPSGSRSATCEPTSLAQFTTPWRVLCAARSTQDSCSIQGPANDQPSPVEGVGETIVVFASWRPVSSFARSGSNSWTIIAQG